MKKYLAYLITFIFSLPLIAAPMPLIIDTDVDMDDMMAILYLLKSDQVDIKAITTTGSGMSHYKYGAPNALNLLQLAGHPNIPVSYGAKESLSPEGEFPPSWRKAVDNVVGIKLPKNPNHASLLKSDELMIKIISESPQKVSLLCIAPMTNLALALQKKPSIKSNIERIYIMGGAIHVKGNIINKLAGFKNHVSEYNIALDAKASSMIFESGIPITLVPLDATDFVPITNDVYNKLNAQKRTPSANFVFEVIKPYIQSQKGYQIYFWDPLAATLITDPKIGCYEELPLKINRKIGPNYGQVQINKKGNMVEVCLSVNRSRFYSTFIQTLEKP